MKNLLPLFLLLFSISVNAQTTITAGGYTPTVGTTFTTGNVFITFAIRNNNNFPIVITNLTTLEANLYENNSMALYYSSSSLGGLPVVPGAGWTLVSQSLQPITTTVIGQVTPFNCIGLVIPQNTTYRFALTGTKGLAMRSNGAGTLAPLSFSAGGVDVLTGDFILPGQSQRVGYLGGPTLPSFITVYWDGTISFIQAPAFTDVQVLSITKPSTACNATNSFLSALVCNKSPQTLNIANNNITVNFNVNGPNGIQTNSFTMNSGAMAPCSCLNAAISGVNFSANGKYIITANANIAGVTDNNLINNTFVDSLINYKPVVSPNDSVCQYSNAGVFAGFTASSCTTRKRTFVLNTTVITPSAIDGSSDATAGNFALGSLPLLPDCSVITGGSLLIENLAGNVTSTFGNEARFNIFGVAPNGPSNPFVPGVAGNPLNFSVYNFDYKIFLTAAQLNAMYAALGAGGTFNIGYWETIDDAPGATDATHNAQGQTTTAKLTIEYEIQPCPKWFLTPTGGTSVSNSSSFNPFLVPATGITNTNTVGTYTFYAACSADTICRVPVTLKIKPSPIVVQDTLAVCEILPSSGNALFDLTSLNSNVSGGNGAATVNYYFDIGTSSLIPNPTQFNSTSTVVYSKVSLSGGCGSSDSVILQVNSKPDFGNTVLTGSACAPNCLNVGNLINPFALIPPGTDTLYFENPALTIPHPNPNSICISDTVYMILQTSDIPSCTDTAAAYVSIGGGSNHIANQDIQFNFSNCGSVAANQFVLTDGNVDTLRTFTDCSKVVAIQDVADGTSLGNITVTEDIACSTLTHNGQPYVNRSYEITPTNNDSAIVCLYYLDDDFNLYNTDAFNTGWPQLPNASNMGLMNNLCITQVSNGVLGSPGSIPTSIPNSMISASYDAATTVWTVCFPVSGFSSFYCHACNLYNAPLPVSWNLFEVKKSGSMADLKWVTGYEKNNHYFQVERSADAKLFKVISDKIPTQAVAGTSSLPLEYHFTDEHPLSGQNYYRIRQVDLDKKENLSMTRQLIFGGDISIKVYPNPVQNQLNVEIFAPVKSKMEMTILDASGRLIKQHILDVEEGINQTGVNMSDLANGVYLLKFKDSKGWNEVQVIRKNVE